MGRALSLSYDSNRILIVGIAVAKFLLLALGSKSRFTASDGDFFVVGYIFSVPRFLC